jgi:serine phosphatase RsbU (regulator of sigma subunit)/PAS domain-containing protein
MVPEGTDARSRVDLAAMAQALRDDEERLARSRRLLGTTGSARLDRVAAVAAARLGAPAARVSLLTRTRTVAAAAGSPGVRPGHRSALEDTLCTVAAASRAPFAVTDALTDERLRALPAVATGGLRSYLGVPLVGAEGHVLGVLCVHGPDPRAWSTADAAALTDLGGRAVAALEDAVRDLDQAVGRRRRELAAALGRTGVVDWDPPTGRLTCDDQALGLLGLGRAPAAATPASLAARLHPEDADRVRALVALAVTGGEASGSFRVVHPDGAVHRVEARGAGVVGPAGSVVRVVGVLHATTAEHDADTWFARVLGSMPGVVVLLDREWRIQHLNPEALRLLGAAPEDLLGQVLWRAFPSASGSGLGAALRAAARTGSPQHLETYLPGRWSGWYEVRAWPGPDGLAVCAQDVTARVRAEHDAARARRHAERALRSAQKHARDLALLAAVRDDLAATLDAEEGVGRFARRVVPALGSWCVVTLADHDGTLRDVASWHADPGRRALAARYAALRQPALSPDSFLRRALRTGAPVVLPDAGTAGTTVLTGEARSVYRELAPRTAYLVPMRARERNVGVLSLYLDDGVPDLDPEDAAMLTQLADRAGLMLDNARLYAEQRHIAETLQRSLLSDPVQPAGARVATRYVAAAAAAQVGGDWYDAFPQPGGGSVLVIGDVMGHDTRATAGMSQVRTLLRGIAHCSGLGPAALLRALDQALSDLDVHTIATAVVLHLEADASGAAPARLRWASAGHLPPVLIRPDGAVHELPAARPGLVLGVRPDAERGDAEAELPPGSVVLLYTDGLVERRGEDLRTGLARLRTVLADLAAQAGGGRHLEPDGLLEQVLERMLPAGRTDDDVAVLAVAVGPGTGAAGPG